MLRFVLISCFYGIPRIEVNRINIRGDRGIRNISLARVFVLGSCARLVIFTRWIVGVRVVFTNTGGTHRIRRSRDAPDSRCMGGVAFLIAHEIITDTGVDDEDRI